MASTGFGGLPFGLGPFGTELNPLRVERAASISRTIVRLDFSAALDAGHASNFNPAYYVIAGLSVTNVDVLGPSSVILQTTLQTTTTYNVVVSAAVGVLQAASGAPLDPSANTASFVGGLDTGVFDAVAQSPLKLRLNFSTDMQIDSAFLDPQNYEIAEGDGLPVAVDVVATIGDDLRRAEVLLKAELTPFALYSLRVSASVRTVLNAPLFPDQAVVRWLRAVPQPIKIRIAEFSGEVTGGLLGAPAGQVFFSPAFGSTTANSLIEVEQVSVCTKAYDICRRPPEPARYQATFLGPAVLAPFPVLWGPAHLIGDPAMVLTDLQEDVVPTPSDGDPAGLLVETIDITRASFLNDGRWRLFPGTGASLGAFRTADNATPIGPGPTIGPFSIP